MFQTEHLQEKWQLVLDHPDLPKIEDSYKLCRYYSDLGKPRKSLKKTRVSSQKPVSVNNSMGGGQMDTWDPILISLVRRSMPNLIAYDVCGVQSMTGPTGLIFAMRSSFTSQDGAEVLVDSQCLISQTRTLPVQSVVVIGATETNPAVLNDSPSAGTYVSATGMTRAEQPLGDSGKRFRANGILNREVNGYRRVPCPQGSEYTMELAQDLGAIHGLDAETELSNILSPQKSLLKSTVKSSVHYMSPLLRVLRPTRQLPVSLILTLTPTVVGRLRSSKV